MRATTRSPHGRATEGGDPCRRLLLSLLVLRVVGEAGLKRWAKSQCAVRRRRTQETLRSPNVQGPTSTCETLSWRTRPDQLPERRKKMKWRKTAKGLSRSNESAFDAGQRQ